VLTVLFLSLGLGCLLVGTSKWSSWARKIAIQSANSLQLGRQRTNLATTRTWLAYIRTVMGFTSLAAVASTISGWDGKAMLAFFTVVALYLGVDGLRKLRQKRWSDPSTGAHALTVMRTELANTRTWLAILRTAHPTLALVLGTFKKFDLETLVITASATLVVLVVGLANWQRTLSWTHEGQTVHAMALCRTRLANIRCMLAYIRTSLALAALGISRIVLFPEMWSDTHTALFVSSGCVFAFGVGFVCLDWRRMQRIAPLRDMEDSDGVLIT
jgi:uncharacterized membrane protein YidH (DUF202 family)